MDVDEPIMHRDHQKEGLDSCNRADYCTVSPYREKRWDEFKFPTKLHVVLDLAIEEKFEDILCWSPHGKAFRIHDKQKFGNQIMPKYFPGISKFKSFQRQLNLYGIRQRGIPLTTEFAEHGINRTRGTSDEYHLSRSVPHSFRRTTFFPTLETNSSVASNALHNSGIFTSVLRPGADTAH